jgi:creatinine amidohydrolase
MRWEHLTPPDFTRAVKETKLCVVPFGSLERHGDHLPYGTDGIIVHTIACRAAEIEPCVVFPHWWFGQVHEAGCFRGSINFPPDFQITLLGHLMDQIASNGFEKILILNGHGGNDNMLQYFAMANVDRPHDYTLYYAKYYDMDLSEAEHAKLEGLFAESAVAGGHASADETSLLMACQPGVTKLEYNHFPEPILPMDRFKHLGRIYSGLWWYDQFPENVTGVPSQADAAKGQVLLDTWAGAVARVIARVKADTAVPALQKEFEARAAQRRMV